MESKTIKLRYPVEVEGAKHSELTMRRPLVGDLRAAQRSAGAGATGEDTEIALFTNLCEVPPALWDKMDLGDYLEVQEAYAGFLSRASTGAARGTSSRTSSHQSFEVIDALDVAEMAELYEDARELLKAQAATVRLV